MANVSRHGINEATRLGMLATGDGPGHLVRAAFGDCALDTLDRMAANAEMDER